MAAHRARFQPGADLPYYICGYAVYYGGSTPTGTCHNPAMFVDSLNQIDVQTHEIRFATNPANRWRLQGGFFSSETELIEVNDFTYPGSVHTVGWHGEKGFASNYPLTNTEAAPGNPSGSNYNAAGGYYTYPGPFPQGVIFRNDIRRTDGGAAISLWPRKGGVQERAPAQNLVAQRHGGIGRAG